MGRRKHRPHRSVRIIEKIGTAEENSVNVNGSDTLDANDKEKVANSSRFIDIDRSFWNLDEHLDIAEVIVTDSRSTDGFSGYELTEGCDWDSEFSFRLRLLNVEEYADRLRLGHWPVISTENIFLEILHAHTVDDSETEAVIFSGVFDGPDEGVSGLVHLVNQKMMMVRVAKQVKFFGDASTIRVRVEMLKSAFDACESLLEDSKQHWKRSMMSVMDWLRPEVTALDAIYGINSAETSDIDTGIASGGNPLIPRKCSKFDAASFYEAIKPSKEEPMLSDELPDLLPELRPYQRRAAYWMVQREKGGSMDHYQFLRPLCVPVDFLQTHSRMYYNPFSGNISLHMESSSSYVSGGILADEMGLGKTVELLACIFAHRKSTSEGNVMFDILKQDTEGQRDNLKRLKMERVECICGAVNESLKYKGLWVQCDVCDAWQHADCVNYSPDGKPSEISKTKDRKTDQSVQSRNNLKKKNGSNIVETGGYFICQLCLELMQACHSPVATGATLIVCPSSILHQWQAEIVRHTSPGSLRICVYEGVRKASLSDTPYMDISELVRADVVLTTYDVLKEDLCHDSDRHERDRRAMRFQKRYPVIPTLLTRVLWWRICLDEAQMVESNTAAATEMALRLPAKHRWCITGTPIQRRLDDLYGLLRFLNASPFELHRWWLEVLRDPYERREARAMEFVHKFFKQIMWRSSKVHVADELQLPPQEESVSWLLFSPIEAQFYQRQHETCASYACEFIKTFKDGIQKTKVQDSESIEPACDTTLTHAEAAKLLHSLLKLRQACCHPQVGSSRLRSMEHSPMTMDEVLGVLIGKTKTEGEEALRGSVIALNALAGIAVLEQNLSHAVSLYREALALSKEHYDDFRLDPLLNLHIHSNLAEILSFTSGYSLQCKSTRGQSIENSEEEPVNQNNGVDQYSVKRQKISKEGFLDLTTKNEHLEHLEKQPDFTFVQSATAVNGEKGMEYDVQPQVLPRSLNDGCLRMMCEKIKEKYLSVFISKLSLAQQEFRNSYTQVCNALEDQKNQHTSWWWEILHHVEQSKDSSNELMRRVTNAVSGTLNTSKSSRIAARFQSISSLMYFIQTGLDSLKSSRQALVEQLLDIDKTMEKPRDEDILRVRYCKKCRDNGDGPLCVLCELDNLFQVYQARLFRLTKQGAGGGAMVESAEEAIDLQKKKSDLNRFYWGLSRQNKGSSSSVVVDEDNKKQRDVRERIMVSRSPSELEVVLGVLKIYCKACLGKDGTVAATKQLHLFEVLRKEHAQARSLANAQVQILNAHDEMKMSTSRLRLRENDSDTSIDALSSEELVTANVEFTSSKYMSLSSLSRIKGQLRYLKGLVLSKQKAQPELPNSATHVRTDNSATASHTKEQGEFMGKADDETCPVCHETLCNQKMVFQCGHVTCCKCLVAITEHRFFPHGKSRYNWVMCPKCRQPTDLGNIAFVDDGQKKASDSSIPSTFECFGEPEASINVQGSYGTKIGAVTRRILWIKSTDPKAKVLVFSSWNDVLDVLEHAFSANSISYIRMKGGRKSHFAIAQFKGKNGNVERANDNCEEQAETKSFQVLLLLIQHGANGLNLLEAQHVILVEPLLNPAAEAQAINRVHRIGQDKRTLVHRFIVKDTIEESIFKLNRSKNTNTIIGANTKNQDQPVLTLKDVESLFSSATSVSPVEHENIPPESLMHLPPAVAAALAAERRWKE